MRKTALKQIYVEWSTKIRQKLTHFVWFQTPDGIVQKKHWEALLKYEQFVKPNLKVAYKLTPTHLNPIGYQKMNVPLAFQACIVLISWSLNCVV